MLEIGRYNSLIVSKTLPRGLYLDAGEQGEILLPKQYLNDDMDVGDTLNVFIYRDSEDRLIATTEKPFAQVGEFAYLNVVDTTEVGAFLDWGLPKNLFVPFSEQHTPLVKGTKALVGIYVDNSDRIAASSRLDSFLYEMDEQGELKAGEEVDLIIANKTDLGYKMIVNECFWGLVYHSDVFQELRRGEKIKGYVQRIREDKKIELTLQPPGRARVDPVTAKVLERLKGAEGFLPLNDKSDPELIKREFSCSKKSFKQAIGSLYKQRLIRIESDGIHLL